jgi:hypothetical protein
MDGKFQPGKNIAMKIPAHESQYLLSRGEGGVLLVGYGIYVWLSFAVFAGT